MELHKPKNLYELLTLNMEQRFANRVAFRWYDADQDVVVEKHFGEYAQDIRRAVNYYLSTIPDIQHTGLNPLLPFYINLSFLKYLYIIGVFGANQKASQSIYIIPEFSLKVNCFFYQLGTSFCQFLGFFVKKLTLCSNAIYKLSKPDDKWDCCNK